MTSQVRLSEVIGEAFFDLFKTIRRNPPKEVWCKGGRGSLKSSFISIAIMVLLTLDPKAHAFVARRYDNELRETVFGQIMWACSVLGISELWRFMYSPMQAVNHITGQKIIFKGIDNPKKTKSINLGTGYIKYLWIEEADQFAGYGEIRTIIQSIFRGEGDNRMAFYSYNPPKSARSWVNQEVKIPMDGRIVHSSDYRTAPPHWLGERFLADAEHIKKVNDIAYRHEYLGEEVGTGLEVFNNVELSAIDSSQFTTIRQGIDFGYAVDPFVFVEMYYDTKKRHLYIFGEISGVGLSNRVAISKLSARQKHTMTYADSAEPKSIDELRSLGMQIRPCTKGAGSVDFGIKWLQDLEKIIIDPVACPRSAKEFINYALEYTRGGEIISSYPDKDNHTIDAVRYGLEEVMLRKEIKGGVKL